MKDKGIWKYVLTNKAVFLNKDLTGQLTGDKSSTYKLLLEGHISVLFFSADFGSQAMLSWAVLPRLVPSSPEPHGWSTSSCSRSLMQDSLWEGAKTQSLLHRLHSGYPNTEAQPGLVQLRRRRVGTLSGHFASVS